MIRVLGVLGREQVDRVNSLDGIGDDGGLAGGSNPPQVRPILLVVVEQELSGGVRLDVGQPLEKLSRFRLVVDRRIDQVTCDHEADRHQVRATGGGDGGETADASCRGKIGQLMFRCEAKTNSSCRRRNLRRYSERMRWGAHRQIA